MYKLFILFFITRALSFEYPMGLYDKTNATIDKNLLCIDKQCIPFFKNSFIMFNKFLIDICHEETIIYDNTIENEEIYFPKGTYANSCHDLKVHGSNYLCAKCINEKSCVYFKPYQHIINSYGHLKIDYPKSPIYIINNNLSFPTGEYIKSCFEISINEQILTASCLNSSNGVYVQNKINYDKNAILINHYGELKIKSLNKYDYLHYPIIF